MQVGSKSFIIPNDKDIYCVKCFEDKIATKCTKCKNILTSGGVTFRYSHRIVVGLEGSVLDLDPDPTFKMFRIRSFNSAIK
jgi:hypothetical protein